MPTDQIVLGLTWFVVFLFSTTLHEAGHAFAAYKLGDPTAYEGGQVSLNPLPHIQREPVGMILVPLIIFVTSQGRWMMGWASAPYDPAWAHRYPKRAAVMALAGPAANLLLVLVSGLAIRLGLEAGGGWAEGLVATLSILFSLNLLLFFFNLLPLPPLDGSAVIPAFLSDSAAQRYREFLHQPFMSLLGLVVAWKIFPYIFAPLRLLAIKLLYLGLESS